MKTSFGPWTTAIHAGAYPQLSTFWRKRMTMLPIVEMNRSMRGRDVLGLIVPAILLLTVPLIRLQQGAVGEEPAAKPKEERILYWWKHGRLATIRPDGKDQKWVTEAAGPGYHPVCCNCPAFSPDGRRIAYGISKNPAPPTQDQDQTSHLYIKAVDEEGLGVDMGIDAHMWVWSPDGTKLVVAKWDRDAEKQMKMVVSHWLLDVKTKEMTELKIPENHLITDWSRDGKWFLTSSFGAPGKNADAPPHLQLNLVKRDGSEVRRLGKPEPSAAMGRLSPDGKKVLFMKMGDKRGEAQLFVMNLADGKTTQVSKELNAEPMGHCWSPDSKRIAYIWRQTNPAPGAQTESFLMIVDADGKNPVTLVTEKEDNQGTITLASPDWR